MAYDKTLDNFIPEVWSKQLLKNWDDSFVMRRLVNTQFEGEIRKFGDTVHVPYLGNIAVADYDNNPASGDPVSYEEVSDYSDTLTIDQRKYWAFKVEDIERAQAAERGFRKLGRSFAAGLGVATPLGALVWALMRS